MPDGEDVHFSAERSQRGWFRRLRRNPAAMTALGCLVFIVLAAIVGPWMMPSLLNEPSSNQFAPPSGAHLFGTDLNGRDVLYRVLAGARISLAIGLTGAVISLFVGGAFGLIAGYAGGRTDSIMMRAVEILQSIPRLIIILISINAFDSAVKQSLVAHGLIQLAAYSRIGIMVVCLGLIEWLSMARIVRGQVLTLKTAQFVTAARSLGQSHHRILTRHLLPNLTGVIIVYLTLTVPAVILDESFLSFLGLGISAPQASWGTLLSDGAQVINPIRSNWWLLLFPALAVSITLLALNFLGDAIRDALDPRTRK